jgi:cobalt-zinc-cadmium efflux system membrane fusion protein
MSPRRGWRLLLSLFLLGAVSPVLATEMVQLEPAALERAGVAVEAVESRAFGDLVRVVGQVVRQPGATVEVKSILGGRVEQLHAAPGAKVRSGQPLLTLHSHELHQLQGELLSAHEALRLALNQVEAGEQLLALEAISRLELDRRRQQGLAARLALQAVEAELEDLGYGEAEIARLVESSETHPALVVRAPADGVVLELGVELHGWVAPLEPLMMLGNPERLELELQLPPEEAARVAAGDRVVFGPVGRPELEGQAQVIAGVPQVDPMTRTVTVRAELVDGRGRLLPGVFVEGVLHRGVAESAPAVPAAAVARLGAADHVFVRRDATRFEARPVQLGRFDGSHYEIVAGLAAGEEVAVEGVFLLKSALVRSEGG